MEGNTFQSWKIENFTCWDKNVHDECIKSPPIYFSFYGRMELYPRGVKRVSKVSHQRCSVEDRLKVRFCDIQKRFSGGELSFIGSGGYVFGTLKVNRVNSVNVLDSPVGPKYDDVIDRIRSETEDQLTVQFVPPSGKIYEQCPCTSIDVLQISLEIDHNLSESIKPGVLKHILFSSYTAREEGMFFEISRNKGQLMLLLQPFKKDEKAVLVKSFVRLIRNNCVLERYEDRKHVFMDKEPWIFSDWLKIEDFADKSTTLMVSFKITKCGLKKSYNRLLYVTKGVTIVQNADFCFPERKSSKDLKPFSSKPTSDSVTKPTCDPTEKDTTPIESSVSALSKELTYLYQDQDFSDLRIECGAISFPVHKNILGARSPVLKCLLSSDMQEVASGRVDITDMDAPTLARFLNFLYSGTVDELEVDSAIKLYYAADKYQVPTLKRDCVDFLRANVSKSNACDILSLADKHQDDELLSAARDFILDNCNEVTRSEEWRSLMQRQPLLVAETMTHFAAKGFVKKSIR